MDKLRRRRIFFYHRRSCVEDWWWIDVVENMRPSLLGEGESQTSRVSDNSGGW